MANKLRIQSEGGGFLAEGQLAGRPTMVEAPTIDQLRAAVQERIIAEARQTASPPLEVVLDDQVMGQHYLLRATPDGGIQDSPLEPQAVLVDAPPAYVATPPAPSLPASRPPAMAPVHPAAEAPASQRPAMPSADVIPDPPSIATDGPAPVELPVFQDPAEVADVPPPHAQPAPAPSVAAPERPQEVAPAPQRPTREDFMRARPGAPVPAAVFGWQGTVNRLSLGRAKLAPGEVEQRHRAAVASVQRSLSGPKTIVVLNPKGGAHKTTATLMIAATFGVHRGGSTLAWDNNETQGTLGARAIAAHHDNTAVSLLGDIERFRRLDTARFGDLDNYVRNQGEAKFDVLASDNDPTSPAIMTGDDFALLHDTLARFYRVIVVDTGNNPRASNWQAAVDAADQLVIVSTVRDDTASVAAGLIDRLHALGLGHKVDNGVTVLSDPSPTRDRELSARLTDHFSRLTRAVAQTPYEPAFVGGSELNLELLRPTTREAWLQACSLIAEGLNQ